jgi:hypothetical protein
VPLTCIFLALVPLKQKVMLTKLWLQSFAASSESATSSASQSEQKYAFLPPTDCYRPSPCHAYLQEALEEEDEEEEDTQLERDLTAIQDGAGKF